MICTLVHISTQHFSSGPNSENIIRKLFCTLSGYLTRTVYDLYAGSYFVFGTRQLALHYCLSNFTLLVH
jgi:hypothetical protein